MNSRYPLAFLAILAATGCQTTNHAAVVADKAAAPTGRMSASEEAALVDTQAYAALRRKGQSIWFTFAPSDEGCARAADLLTSQGFPIQAGVIRNPASYVLRVDRRPTDRQLPSADLITQVQDQDHGEVLKSALVARMGPDGKTPLLMADPVNRATKSSSASWMSHKISFSTMSLAAEASRYIDPKSYVAKIDRSVDPGKVCLLLQRKESIALQENDHGLDAFAEHFHGKYEGTSTITNLVDL